LNVPSSGTFVGQNCTKNVVSNGQNQPFWRFSVTATYQSGFDAENASNRRSHTMSLDENGCLDNYEI
jgi:hypothetical protein